MAESHTFNEEIRQSLRKLEVELKQVRILVSEGTAIHKRSRAHFKNMSVRMQILESTLTAIQSSADPVVSAYLRQSNVKGSTLGDDDEITCNGLVRNARLERALRLKRRSEHQIECLLNSDDSSLAYTQKLCGCLRDYIRILDGMCVVAFSLQR